MLAVVSIHAVIWGLCCYQLVGAVDMSPCPSFDFFSDVVVRCISYPDAPREEHYLQVEAKNMENYRLVDVNVNDDKLLVNIHFETPNVDKIVISDPAKFSPNELVGVALDGVPIYSSLIDIGVDGLAPDPSTGLNIVELDQCGGSYSKVGTVMGGDVAERYHYRALPACILDTSDTENKRKTLINDVHELMDGFSNYYGPRIIGYSITGYPIYSPYDWRGHLQDSLDSCNGKFNMSVSGGDFAPNNDVANSALYMPSSPGVLSPYGYYAAPTFPYIVGCDGPGVYSTKELELPVPDMLMQNTGSKLSTCPAGYMRSEMYENGCIPCPAGKYSTATYANGRSSCNMDCPVGHYCPAASVAPRKCAGGRYGSSRNLQTAACSGVCRAGYYCPEGSASATAFPCGNENFFCPLGSSARTQVLPGHYTDSDTQISTGIEDIKTTVFSPEPIDDVRKRTNQAICPVGHYCTGGRKHRCPAGRYGAVPGLVDPHCSDVGSASLLSYKPTDPAYTRNSTCPIGYYCPEGSVGPTICPAGTFGSEEGLTTSDCSGLCERGYWCQAGSTNSTQNACAPGIYGPTKGLKTADCNENCEVVLEPTSTLATTITTTVGLLTADSLPLSASLFCTARQCKSGFYCPSGSTSSMMFDCGTNASMYCPPGSSVPTAVDLGFYTVGAVSRSGEQQSEEDVRNRVAQVECEPGHYCIEGVRYICPQGHSGMTSGLHEATCSGLCDAGYYCRGGSASSKQYPCKDAHVYCPLGSYEPTAVPNGFYSVGHNDSTMATRSDISPCPPGHYCIGGIIRPCDPGRYSVSGSPSAECDGLCSVGYYCPVASTSREEVPCPAGRYGSTVGSINDHCTGSCLAGYYCPTASTSPEQYECGDDNVFCPSGSDAPIAVDIGHYTTGGTDVTRSNQAACGVTAITGTPPSGGIRENICPSTTMV